MTAAIVRVLAGDEAYDVVVDRGALDRIGARFAEQVAVGTAMVVTDDRVGPLYAERALAALAAAGFRAFLHVIPAGEGSKTLVRAEALYDALATAVADRSTLVVGLGGGVVGDLAGFVAATWKRGVPLGLVPTSLLAMVDASIGGKTGVNRPAGKNLVGAFHSPRAVVADPDLLATLPADEMRMGLAEAVKTAIVGDAELFAGLEGAAERAPVWPEPTIDGVVFRCARVKAGVVTRDAREAGERRTLNLGHTLGHALETATGHALRHGEAVAIGLAFVARATASPAAGRIVALLDRLGLPTAWPDGADADRVVATIRQDKKAQGGEPLWVVPAEIGATRIEPIDGWERHVHAFAADPQYRAR